MADLLLTISASLSPAMESLRSQGFAGKTKGCRDAFDSQSVHFSVTRNDDVVAMVRATRQPPSVLSEWAETPSVIPTGEDVVEVTRAVVSAAWRGLGLYKLLLAHTTLFMAKTAGMQRTVGAVELDFPGWPFLQCLGFEEVGISDFVDPPVVTGRRGRCILQRHRHCIVQARSVIKTVVSELEDKSHSFSVDDSFHDQLLD